MSFRLSIYACAFSLLVATAGCRATLSDRQQPAAGTYRLATERPHLGFKRTFLLHVPPDVATSAPLPLVMVLHGAFSSGGKTERETGFSELADRERFLVAYPEGIGLFGLLQHWNAGHCCGRAAKEGIDDVDFIAHVIRQVQKRFPVDQGRIYLAGMSNGGMLAYRFAAERPGIIAAVAVVAGSIASTVMQDAELVPPQLPREPLPVLVMHGRDDRTIPATGNTGNGSSGGRRYLPATATAATWLSVNGCRSEAEAGPLTASGVTHQKWHICDSGFPVELVLLDGWGHLWPTPRFTGRLGPEHPLRDFDGSRHIWEFFSRFSLAGERQGETADTPKAP